MSDLGKTNTQSYNDWLDKHDKDIRADERADIIKEIDIHLSEVGYTYDSNIGIGDNIGLALRKEGKRMTRENVRQLTIADEERIRADELKKFAEWCKLKGYGCYDWRMLLEQYEKENRTKTPCILDTYQQDRKDGMRKFAEWFKESDYYLCYNDSIDEVIAKYEKEQEIC